MKKSPIPQYRNPHVPLNHRTEDMKEATKALKDSKRVQEDEMQELRALLTKTKAEERRRETKM